MSARTDLSREDQLLVARAYYDFHKENPNVWFDCRAIHKACGGDTKFSLSVLTERVNAQRGTWKDIHTDTMFTHTIPPEERKYFERNGRKVRYNPQAEPAGKPPKRGGTMTKMLVFDNPGLTQIDVVARQIVDALTERYRDPRTRAPAQTSVVTNRVLEFLSNQGYTYPENKMFGRSDLWKLALERAKQIVAEESNGARVLVEGGGRRKTYIISDVVRVNDPSIPPEVQEKIAEQMGDAGTDQTTSDGSGERVPVPVSEVLLRLAIDGTEAFTDGKGKWYVMSTIAGRLRAEHPLTVDKNQAFLVFDENGDTWLLVKVALSAVSAAAFLGWAFWPLIAPFVDG